MQYKRNIIKFRNNSFATFARHQNYTQRSLRND